MPCPDRIFDRYMFCVVLSVVEQAGGNDIEVFHRMISASPSQFNIE